MLLLLCSHGPIYPYNWFVKLLRSALVVTNLEVLQSTNWDTGSF